MIRPANQSRKDFSLHSQGAMEAFFSTADGKGIGWVVWILMEESGWIVGPEITFFPTTYLITGP